jgi:hypothetical protein
MWIQAISLASKAATHIYKNKQETKMLMSDAEKRHALAMAKGEKEYQGKLLNSRDSDWKDEFILLLLSAPIVLLAWAEIMIKNFKDIVILLITAGVLILLGVIIIGDYWVAVKENRAIDDSIIVLMKMSVTGLIGVIGGYIGGSKS